MKLTIQAEPGELAAKLPEVIAKLRKAAGGDCCGEEELLKALPQPRKLEFKALQGSVEEAAKERSRILKVVQQKMDKLLGE